MKIYYCWKCRRDMPFLDETEWAQVAPLYVADKEAIVEYRNENGTSLKDARTVVQGPAAQKFEELTGFKGVHFDIIHHHRLSDWGPECPHCKHLLRTSEAKFCANCGWEGT